MGLSKECLLNCVRRRDCGDRNQLQQYLKADHRCSAAQVTKKMFFLPHNVQASKKEGRTAKSQDEKKAKALDLASRDYQPHILLHEGSRCLPAPGKDFMRPLGTMAFIQKKQFLHLPSRVDSGMRAVANQHFKYRAILAFMLNVACRESGWRLSKKRAIGQDGWGSSPATGARSASPLFGEY